MQISSVSPLQSESLSILKAANQQPSLAGDLISRTVESLMQAQSMQSPAQPVAQPAGNTVGTTIDIIA